MSTGGGAGYRCAYCGTFVSGTDMHWCPQMNPNWKPTATGLDSSAPGGPLDRIATALERIADALGGERP